MISEQEKGCLYLVATPIGNLEDMTYRGVRILNEVDLIAAEDTRNTRKLLSHYDIHTLLTSYHEHNKFTKGPQLIEKLNEGMNIAVVSDAGLPGVADPGTHIAQLAIAEGIRVVPIPGANAALSALICSGLDTVKFTFIGFLPKTSKKRRELLLEIKNRMETLIFYETPYHLKDMLKELIDVLGEDRQAATCRELTKKFEEFKRGTLGQLRDYFAENEPRGEFVVVVSGCKEDFVEKEQEAVLTPVEYVKKLVDEGNTKKEAMKIVAKKLNMSRRDVYQAVLADEK
ncbi:Ribosomal RNA small subunit methyltransferase I [Megamonas hypermegale]|uniref:Ribosomal RNA small subunit methyltransferase I n=1 Tax=Megamonas hypermegale TaxID=158847 RepID=A0A239TCC1_9FIRM|nr:16S rRNA (cytidine(1402)-2'-O)-methyltransferase [Megamonas hypermegale]SNU94728.1 Ribosomal RNA small subunit methyltransferase I [Megamonas hypermegale]